MRIWVIDDNPLHSSLVRAVLENRGDEYKIFSSVREIKEFICKENFEQLPDIVFIDLHLDKESRGEDLLEFFKTNLKGKSITYIAFTADIESRKDLLDLGFNNVIYKPITKERLEALIGDIIHGTKKDHKYAG
ncbi:hypothetical protein JCM13304A_10770 [Desulfothermus okinawensis JCM 13304]